MARGRGIPPIAVLVSGRGTNMQALITAIRTGRLHARVAVVVSDRREAFALTRARRAGIPSVVLDPRAWPSREAFDRQLVQALRAYRVRLVCLAGFMRILSPVVLRAFPRRILNIHPALLPAFPGAHAVREALTWGVQVTGVTVHLVDHQVDHGPIVLQEAVSIRPRDTEARLLARLHRVEHRLYPEAIRLLLAGRVRVSGRRAQITLLRR